MSVIDEQTQMRRAVMYRHEKYSEKDTQYDMALDYLKTYGTLTPLEALNAFGCFRLAAVISDLRKDGYDIETEISKGKKHYATYILREGESDA